MEDKRSIEVEMIPRQTKKAKLDLGVFCLSLGKDGKWSREDQVPGSGVCSFVLFF